MISCRRSRSSACPAFSRAWTSASADGTYERKLARFSTPRLLVIDDLGLGPLVPDEPTNLYEIIRQRHERAATIMISNRDVSEWYPLLGDALVASAAMDRLLLQSHILVLDGQSYRTARKVA